MKYLTLVHGTGSCWGGFQLELLVVEVPGQVGGAVLLLEGGAQVLLVLAQNQTVLHLWHQQALNIIYTSEHIHVVRGGVGAREGSETIVKLLLLAHPYSSTRYTVHKYTVSAKKIARSEKLDVILSNAIVKLLNVVFDDRRNKRVRESASSWWKPLSTLIPSLCGAASLLLVVGASIFCPRTPPWTVRPMKKFWRIIWFPSCRFTVRPVFFKMGGPDTRANGSRSSWRTRPLRWSTSRATALI